MRILQCFWTALISFTFVCGLLVSPVWAEFEFRPLGTQSLSESFECSDSFWESLSLTPGEIFWLDESLHYVPRGLSGEESPAVILAQIELKPEFEREAEVEPVPDFEDFEFPEEDEQVYPCLEQWGHFQIQFDDSRLGARGTAVPARSGLAPDPAIDNLYFRRFRPTVRYHFNPDLFMEFKTNSVPSGLWSRAWKVWRGIGKSTSITLEVVCG